eukprot:CAMPEP_0170200490 /NCGR_PEP_ID=MMETSP0040_2-20121228/69886_1 /TAXON_ID=641309 /ORGANISM="Lotharella oceanica, Strain CCMP622" /LENGTH=87 /DNA_ID=CAMNT_0010450671 /DNA_START=2352 /DNA_END=2615 /DNA_ORIENTATION=+
MTGGEGIHDLGEGDLELEDDMQGPTDGGTGDPVCDWHETGSGGGGGNCAGTESSSPPRVPGLHNVRTHHATEAMREKENKLKEQCMH